MRLFPIVAEKMRRILLLQVEESPIVPSDRTCTLVDENSRKLIVTQLGAGGISRNIDTVSAMPETVDGDTRIGKDACIILQLVRSQ